MERSVFVGDKAAGCGGVGTQRMQGIFPLVIEYKF